ncbi:MAG: VCBS repeat-containing protein [Deltaproteobacteria bacterium]|nr:VCBS repeat-containing protein [Deltaproteobacteria bacterium]MBW2419358.1 VCBS repeat-containing protein [Deltaproteobacteria bacterium]
MLRVKTLPLAAFAALILLAGGAGCGSEEPGTPAAARQADRPPARPPMPEPDPEPSAPAAPDSLPKALVLGLAAFAEKQPGATGPPQPLPARLEFLSRQGGEWRVTFVDDPESNVFHKAMLYEGRGKPELLSAAGSAATLKLWSKEAAGHEAETLWQKDFGGKFSRMRDVEVADIYGDGRHAMAVATHDQGIVATVVPQDSGAFVVEEIDSEPDIFVHEIEIGDLDGDGTLEIYATPSEPNRLDGSVQSGMVVRYVPAKGEGRVVVADLADRHAKEILVEDVDGDGRDELYVVVEGKVAKGTRSLEHRVEIRRYDAGTDPQQGEVIAEIDDRLCRFLTAGDVDGDGKKELVAATFSKGLWLLRPGDPWQVESIDRDSGGFEHASILTDLDGDGRDELYVASDKHREVRRYVWEGGKPARETIYRRPGKGGVFTWNIMPVPIELVP